MRLADLFTRKPKPDTAAPALEKALVAAKAGDYATALSIWEPLARAGNARAQNNIGACFAGGMGVEKMSTSRSAGWRFQRRLAMLPASAISLHSSSRVKISKPITRKLQGCTGLPQNRVIRRRRTC